MYKPVHTQENDHRQDEIVDLHEVTDGADRESTFQDQRNELYDQPGAAQEQAYHHDPAVDDIKDGQHQGRDRRRDDPDECYVTDLAGGIDACD